MKRATTTQARSDDPGLVSLRRRRDRLLTFPAPLTVTQRTQLEAINAQISALGG